MKPQDTADAGMMMCSEADMKRCLRARAAEEMYAALKELLRVDDAWHGSINSEMAQARNAARAALAKADGK